MKNKNTKSVHIIGAGLAGSEATWQCIQNNIPVVLYEMRGKKETFAHKTSDFAELVCSNSLRNHDFNKYIIGPNLAPSLNFLVNFPIKFSTL